MNDKFYDFQLTAFDENGNIRLGTEIQGLSVLQNDIDICLRDNNIKTVNIVCYDKEHFKEKYGHHYPLPGHLVFNTCRYTWWGDLFKEFENVCNKRKCIDVHDEIQWRRIP